MLFLRRSRMAVSRRTFMYAVAPFRRVFSSVLRMVSRAPKILDSAWRTPFTVRLPLKRFWVTVSP